MYMCLRVWCVLFALKRNTPWKHKNLLLCIREVVSWLHPKPANLPFTQGVVGEQGASWASKDKQVFPTGLMTSGPEAMKQELARCCVGN